MSELYTAQNNHVQSEIESLSKYPSLYKRQRNGRISIEEAQLAELIKHAFRQGYFQQSYESAVKIQSGATT